MDRGLMIPESKNIMITRRSRTILLSPLIILFLYSLFFLLFFRNELFFSHFNGSLFIGSPEYIRSLIDKPGGLVLFAGNYLIRFYRFGPAGPLILSSLFVIIFLLLEKIALVFNLKRIHHFIMLVPSCLMLAAQTDMDHHVSNSLGYIVALLFFLACIMNRNRLLISFILIFPQAFLISGFFSFVFAGMFFTYTVVEVKGLKRIISAGIIILLSILVPALSKLFLYLQPWNIILLNPLQFSSSGNPPALLLLVVAYSISMPFILSDKRIGVVSTGRPALMAVGLVFLVIPLTAITTLKDAEKQRTSRLERFVYQEDWDKIISHHHSNAPGNLFDEHYYCLALANRGILCDSMFRTPHLHGINSLILPRENKNLHRQMYYYYYLGLVRETHHLAYESMVNFGYTPENLKFLLKTNIITHKYAVAEKYINILKRTSLESSMNKYAIYLKDTTLIHSDPEIIRQRELLPEKDLFIRNDAYQNLELILLSKPDNTVALQYKMAILMLNRDLESLRYEVNNLLNAGFRIIPLHMEEALLLDKRNRPDLYENEKSFIRSETEERFMQYIEESDKYRLKMGFSSDDFRKRWGNTYWYYFDFVKPDQVSKMY